MRIESIKFKLTVLSICLLYFNFILTSGLNIIDNEAFKLFPRIIAATILIIIITKRENLLIKLICGLLFLFIFYFINDSIIIINLSYILIITLTMKEFPKYIIFPALNKISLSGILLHIILILMGKIDTTVIDQQERIRFSLGFNNPNQLGLFYFSAICVSALSWCEKKTNYNLYIFIIISMLSSYFIFLSDSRTFLLSSILVIGLVFANKINFNFRYINKFIFLIPIFGLIISLCLSSEFAQSFNDELSARPTIFSSFISNHTVLELMTGWIYDSTTGVDNSYLLIISALGFPIGIIFFLLISVKMRHQSSLQSYVVGIAFLLSSFESSIIRPEVPLTILVYSILFASNKSKQEKEINF